jgi:hypothetical protein
MTPLLFFEEDREKIPTKPFGKNSVTRINNPPRK